MHTDDFEVILARIEISVTLHEWAGRKVPGFHFNWDLGLECAFLAPHPHDQFIPSGRLQLPSMVGRRSPSTAVVNSTCVAGHAGEAINRDTIAHHRRKVHLCFDELSRRIGRLSAYLGIL